MSDWRDWPVFDRTVMRRAFRIALVVGTVLALINHGDKIFTANLSGIDLAKIVLTFLVPYCVSTLSSVQAMRQAAKAIPNETPGR